MSLSFVKKALREQIKCFMIYLTVSSMLFTGCASKWSYNWDLGSEQTKKEYTGQMRTELTIDLSISEQSTGSPAKGYTFEIRKDVKSANYKQERKEYYRIDREYRTRPDTKEKVKKGFTAGGAIAGMLGGIVHFALIADDKGWTDEDASFGKDLEGFGALMGLMVGWGLVGAGVGYLIGYPVSAGSPGAKTEYTGDTRRRSLSTDHDWILSNRDTRSTGVSAPDVPVRISSSTLIMNASGQEGKQINIPSNALGVVKVKITGGLENWSEDRSRLISHLESDNRIKSIKLTARPAVLANLLDQVKSESHSFKLQTALDKGTEYVAVNNAEKTVYLSGYGVSSRAFESACDAFIDKEVRRHIKKVRITLKDMDSRNGIASVGVSCETESRTPQSLLSNYFDHPLLDQYAANLEEFESGLFSRTTDRNGSLSANLYVPCLLTVNMTHPDYGTVKQEIFLTEESTAKLVYVPKTGTGGSVRVEDQ